VGGNRLDNSGDVATSTADIIIFNFLINRTLSTTDSAMTMMDIKNYNLGMHLPRYECMRMLLSRCTEKNCKQIKSYGTGRRLLGIHRDQKGHVWIETIRLTSQLAPTETLITIWLLSRSPHTGYVVT
jgi:hypothetical protein